MSKAEAQVFENSIQIQATSTVVEQCICDRQLMHRWLNPALTCEPIGSWNTNLGDKSRFIIKIPMLKPTLNSEVVERHPGLIVWQFKGFFEGRDRWECQPNNEGTVLINRFEFTIPNPLVSWGFATFASNLTQKDMRDQLKRLKRVAEEVESLNQK